MWPLRTAVSGKQMTPAGATEIMEIIGKDETIKRVKAAIEKLSKINMKRNPSQLRAITHLSGPMMVLAGPGSGKLPLLWRELHT